MGRGVKEEIATENNTQKEQIRAGGVLWAALKRDGEH